MPGNSGGWRGAVAVAVAVCAGIAAWAGAGGAARAADAPDAPPPASAPTAPPAKPKKKMTPLETFEEGLVRRAVERHALKIDPHPEGKVITRIVVDREDVLGKGDYYFDFITAFNVFHTTTRESTILRELLFKEGSKYAKSDVEESERRLRVLIIFATVRIVAFETGEPGTVGMLVVTKDLWSLRTNFYVVYNAGVLEYFETNPSENNLFGRYKILTGHIQFDLGKFSFGEGFFEPRLFGTTVQAYEDVWLEFERTSGRPEGVRALARVYEPLFSLHSEYSWILDLNLDRGVDRIFEGADYQLFGAEEFGVGLPIVYRRDRLALNAGVTRSFGYEVKHDFRLFAGYVLDRSRLPVVFPPVDGILRSYPSDLIDAFVSDVLPVGEEYLFALLRYTTTRSRFAKLQNFAALGTTEDFRLGHALTAEVRLGGSLDGNPDFIQAQLDAYYGWKLGDDLLQVSLVARSRYLSRDGAFEGLYRLETVRDGGAVLRERDPTLTRFVNNSLDVEIRNATPLFLFGRLHVRVAFGVRDRDLDRSRFCVGGGYPVAPVVGHGELRGFVTNRFCGTHRIVGNAEWRTLPLNLFSLQVGAAVFADAAVVYGRSDRFVGTSPIAASVGVGLRMQFPQLDREAFRVDLAFPIVGRDPAVDVPLALTVIFLQVF